MVCLVINADRLPHSEVLAGRLAEIEGMTSITLNVNKNKTNVILGKEIKLIWGQKYITDYIGNVKYQISPLSFYQVNPVQTEKLYQLAVEYARGRHGKGMRRRETGLQREEKGRQGTDGNLGSVLWNWDDFFVPCTERRESIWS